MTVIQSAIDNNISNKQSTDTATLSGAIVYEAKSEDTIPNTAAYYFDIIEDHSISVQNQITDNYVENNTAIQDQISQSPITVTLRGLKGEKVFTPSEKSYEELLQKAREKTSFSTFDKLYTLEQLLPEVSNLEQLAWNAYDLVTANVNKYKGIYNVFVNNFNSNSPINSFNGTASATEYETKIQAAFRKLLVLRNNNSALIVETPFKTFQDMYIESLSFHQGNENYICDIEITLKQINFATVSTTAADEKVMAQYNAWARAKEENNGTAQGRTSNNSILYDKFTPGYNYANY